VALSGDAADELFGSYLSHRAAQPMFHFNRLYDKVRNDSLTEEEKDLFKPCDLQFLQGLHEKSGGDEATWRYRLGVFTDEEKGRILSPAFKTRLNGASSHALFTGYFSALTSHDPLNRMLEMEWNTQLPDQVLAFVDFLSMAHSVEVRSPFLDYRLVEFAAAIPGRLKIRKGNVKDVLKRTVESLIPEGITKRPKEGFVLPIFDWMVDKLKNYSTDVLSETRIARHGFFDGEAVRCLTREYYAGNKSLAVKVWNLMMFQIWWETYFG
jgi:asparagine synthase (glutamine-hydrolysing)